MKPQPHEHDWLDAGEVITPSELMQACRISAADLDELVEYGALTPVGQPAQRRNFSRACITSLRAACKLRQDYDLDLFTVALLLEQLIRIEELEREVRFLRAHLPAHVTPAHRDGPQPWREPHATAITDHS